MKSNNLSDIANAATARTNLGAAALAGLASQVFSVAAAAAAANAVRFDQAYGVGQTLQDVTASRALGTNYTNSTGKAIQVMVSAKAAVAGGTCSVTIGTVVIWGSTASAINQLSGVTAVIPAGASYSVSMSGGGSPTLNTWVEIR